MSYLYRVEQHIIKPSNAYYSMIDNYAYASKNMYNKALFIQRQCFFENNKFLNYSDLWSLVKDTDEASKLPFSGLCQTICRQVTNDCYNFKKAIKAFENNPERFNGKVRLPQYKDKISGRNMIELTNNQARIEDGRLKFHRAFNGFEVKLGKEIEDIEEIRIVRRNRNYYLDVVYMIASEENNNLGCGAAIDLGVDNFATIVIACEKEQVNPKIINGKGLKSYNKRFNNKLKFYKSEARVKNHSKMTRRIERLYEKRRNYMKNFMHQASKKTIDWCLENNVKYLVIGYNHGWKNKCKLDKGNYYNFMMIPYEKYIKMVTYKAEAVGIKVILHEEAYTSGTSFIDNEPPTIEYYDKSRRVRRGLFISNNGIKINADVNGAYQIMRKVFPKVTYDNGIVSCCIQPIKYNVA